MHRCFGDYFPTFTACCWQRSNSWVEFPFLVVLWHEYISICIASLRMMFGAFLEAHAYKQRTSRAYIPTYIYVHMYVYVNVCMRSETLVGSIQCVAELFSCLIDSAWNSHAIGIVYGGEPVRMSYVQEVIACIYRNVWEDMYTWATY